MSNLDEDMRPEYDFSGGVRGKHYQTSQPSSNVKSTLHFTGIGVRGKHYQTSQPSPFIAGIRVAYDGGGFVSCLRFRPFLFRNFFLNKIFGFFSIFSGSNLPFLRLFRQHPLNFKCHKRTLLSC